MKTSYVRIEKGGMTDNPLYLLQRKMYHHDLEAAEHYDPDEEAIIMDGKEVTDEELVEMELAKIYWQTEGIFYSRQEAEEYISRRIYHYSTGYRIYGMPTFGELSDLLNDYDKTKAVAV